VKQVLKSVAADQILTIVESGRPQKAGSSKLSSQVQRPAAIGRTDRFEHVRAGKYYSLATGGKLL
jgi:hypothetical protein